jgi:hypothetical protein
VLLSSPKPTSKMERNGNSGLWSAISRKNLKTADKPSLTKINNNAREREREEVRERVGERGSPKRTVKKQRGTFTPLNSKEGD